MTWTKLDRRMIDGPEFEGIPAGARLMHIEAMLYCNEHGTDGAISRAALGKLTGYTRRLEGARQLADAGVWHATDTGWTLPRFLEEQPSRHDTDRTTALSRQRQRKQRQHRNGDHSLCDPRYCRASSTNVTRDETQESRVTHGVSHDTRTAPYRTDPSRKGEGVGYGKGEGPETRATRSGSALALTRQTDPRATPEPVAGTEGSEAPGTILPNGGGVVMVDMAEMRRRADRLR